MRNDRQSLVPVLARLGWMLLGPFLLVLLAILVVNTGNGWFTAADLGFLVVLVSLVFARWLEFRCGRPQTAEGEPATPEHLRRYAIGVICIGLTAWIIANVLGNYVMVATQISM